MEVFNIKFVGEVEKHAELYNNTLPEYSRKDCAEKAWNEIAKQVNMPAAECKEKWRNLRSTFVKHLKPKLGGSGATKKKPYYLAEAMEFAIPFIKVGGTSTGNLPEMMESRIRSSTAPEVFDVHDSHVETILSEDVYSEPHSSSLPPSPRHPAYTPPPLGISPQSRDSLSSPEPVDLRDRPVIKRRKKNVSSDSDRAWMDYFSAKLAKITNTSPETAKREGIQNFLNSLVPDLMSLNDVQLRFYKRRALLLIDEVMGTSTDGL